ncbi:MAG: T9SS type A sorting domain-containing protein [Chitinophagales bacterium]
MRTNPISPLDDFNGESVFTPTFPVEGEDYILSVFINLSFLQWGNGNNGNYTGGLEDFNVLLVDNTDWTASGESGNFPANRQVLIQGVAMQNLPQGSTWLQVVSCFTAQEHPNPQRQYNSLYFVGVNQTQRTYLLLDQVELIEWEHLEDQTLNIVNCGECITIGKEICGSISNMAYQWRNVNTGEILELDGLGNPLNGSESQITVCPKIPTQYELRRNILPSANGLRYVGDCLNSEPTLPNEMATIMVKTPEDCCPPELNLDFDLDNGDIFCFGHFPTITPNIVGGTFSSTSNASFDTLNSNTGAVNFKGEVGQHEICYSIINEFEDCVDFVCKTIFIEDGCCAEDIPTAETVACCLEQTENLINEDFVVTANDNNPITWTAVNNGLMDAFSLPSRSAIKMNSTLFIPNGTNLTINNMEFEFGPNGRIVVEQGGVLFLEFSTLSGLCNSMWQGIRVLGPGFGVKRITNVNYGFLRVSTTTIQHALIGVANANWKVMNMEEIVVNELQNFNEFTMTSDFHLNNTFDKENIIENYNTAGGVCQISKEANFIDCFHGAYFRYYFNTGATGNTDYVRSANFEVQNSLPYPFSEFNEPVFMESGVELDTYNFIDIGANTFSGIKYGVRGRHASGIHLKDEGANVSAINTFEFCEVGVSFKNFLNSILNSSTNIIFDNDFDNCLTAIQARGTDIEIDKNRINEDIIPSQEMLGILLAGCEFEVTNNDIHKTVLATTLIAHPGRGAMPVRNNEYFGNFYDVSIFGDNDAAAVTCNDFYDTEANSIQIRDYPFGTFDPLGMFDDQGDCGDPFIQLPADNRFFSDNVTFDIEWLADTSNPNADDGFTYSHRSINDGNEYLPSVNNPIIVEIESCVGASDYNANCGITGLKSDEDILDIPNEKEKNQAAIAKVKYYVSMDDVESGVDLLENLNTKVADKLLLPYYIENNSFTPAQQILTSFPLHSLNDQQFKDLHSIYLNIKQRGRSWFQLNYAEKQTIRGIAETYTQMGFEAQNLLSTIEGVFYPIPLPEMAGQGGSHKTQIENLDFLVYPNPTTGLFQINYSLETLETGNIILYRADGTMVLSHSFSTKDILDFDIGSLPNGIYYYQFFVENKLLETNKLMLLK